jgi:bifunctional non-homologous end joining protein LigD
MVRPRSLASSSKIRLIAATALGQTRKHNDEVQLYAFDILALHGDDLRVLPLSMRKAHLSRLLARRPDGIFISPFEQGEIGPDLFRAACNMGLEGLVSKRRDRPYRGGRSKDWVK